jgi:hypothetical protein
MSKNLMLVILAICMVIVLLMPAIISAGGQTSWVYNPVIPTLNLNIDTSGKIIGNRFLTVTIHHEDVPKTYLSPCDTVESIWIGVSATPLFPMPLYKNKVIEPVGLCTFTKTVKVEIITEAEIREMKDMKPGASYTIPRFLDINLIYRDKDVGRDGIEDVRNEIVSVIIKVDSPPLSYTSPTPTAGTLATGVAPVAPAFQIFTSSPLPAATVNNAYSYQLSTLGGQAPITFSIISGSLPYGLSMNTAGLICGTPKKVGDHSFRIKAADSGAKTQEKTFSLTVKCTPLEISATTLPDGIVNASYTHQLQTKGGQTPIKYSIATGSSLPSGLSMNSSGLISGSPTEAGNYFLKIQASDSCPTVVQNVEKTLSLTIKPFREEIPRINPTMPMPKSPALPRK